MSPQLYTVVINGMGVPMLVPQNMFPGNDVVGSDNVYFDNGQTDAVTLNDQANSLDELSTLHNTLLVSGQLIATGTAGEPNPPIPVSTIRKPWLDAPDNAVPFDPASAATLPAVNALTTVVSLTVPDGMDGVITAYSWNFVGGGFVQGSGDIIVQVLRDGAAVRNYENILVEKGTIAIPRGIAPLRIYSGQVISMTVFHSANALLNGNVVGSFVGYFYPSQS